MAPSEDQGLQSGQSTSGIAEGVPAQQGGQLPGDALGQPPAEPQLLPEEYLDMPISVQRADGKKLLSPRALALENRQVNQSNALLHMKNRDANMEIERLRQELANPSAPQNREPPSQRAPAASPAIPDDFLSPEAYGDDVLARKLLETNKEIKEVKEHLIERDRLERAAKEQAVMENLSGRALRVMTEMTTANADIAEDPVFRDAVSWRIMQAVMSGQLPREALQNPEPWMKTIFQNTLDEHRSFASRRDSQKQKTIQDGLNANKGVGLQGAGGASPLPNNQPKIATDLVGRQNQIKANVDAYLAQKEARARLSGRG